MAIVSPFRGIHYDLSRVTNLSRVISQPYDVISPEEQQSLHQRHPRNIVWIDFGLDSEGDGPTANKYTRAATWYRQWKSEGTLVRDTAPSLYYYEQEFSLPGRGGCVRKGFLGALRLSAFGEGMVLPHEKTHSRPKEDRLSLMRATEANTSPIFGLYSDPRDEVAKVLRGRLAGTPDFSGTDGLGVKHRMWRVTDPAALRATAEKMLDKKVFIADGHHRYETALAFREEMRKKHGAREDAAYEHVLMFLCNMDDEGVVLLPRPGALRRGDPVPGPPRTSHPRRGAPPRLPLRAHSGDIPGRGHGGTVRPLLQGGAESRIRPGARRAPGRVLPQSRDDGRGPARLPFRPRPPPEGHPLLPADHHGAFDLLRAGR